MLSVANMSHPLWGSIATCLLDMYVNMHIHYSLPPGWDPGMRIFKLSCGILQDIDNTVASYLLPG